MMPDLGVMAFGRGRAMLDLARDAERRGFHSIWSADGNGGDAFASAGAVAAVTDHTTIGTAVALRVRSPVQAVFACGTLDDLTGGRFVHGLGAGPKERMEEWHGLDHDPAVGRMREYIEVIRRVWESTPASPVTYNGRFYRVTNYSRPARSTSARLPIYLGCAGPLMTRLASEVADGLIVHVLHSIAMVRDQTRPEVERGADRVGRDLAGFRLGAGCFTAVDDDRAVALNRARHQVLWALTVPYNPPLLARAGFAKVGETILAALAAGDFPAALRATPDELVDALTIRGTPAEVKTRLAEWGEVVQLITLNGIGAYMNVVPPSWRLPFDELDRNRQAIWNLLERRVP